MLANYLGDKIGLIKFVRNITIPQLGLVEAKCLVENFQEYVSGRGNDYTSPLTYLLNLGKLAGKYNLKQIAISGGKLVWIQPNAVTSEELDNMFKGDYYAFTFNPLA